MIQKIRSHGLSILGWALVGLGLSGSIVGCASVSDVVGAIDSVESLVTTITSLIQ